jgi:hypothetical protein
MSSTIDVYAVSEGRLRQAVGSGDRALAEAVIAGQGDWLAQVDEVDEESELKAGDAVRELIDGRISGSGGGYLYGYALKAICAHLGEELLPNLWGIAGAADWIEEVDGHLAAKGIGLKLSDLVYGGSPVAIPEPDDYPFIGRWAAQDIAAAVAALRAADLSDLEQELAETIGLVRAWVETAGKAGGTMIVGFLY